jgi:tRNA pseudouridine55 synthase
MNGLLVIDKPPGMTSRDVVNRAQGWFPRKTKLGHTGTLDPLATGVLVLCVGAATRLAEYVQAMGKTYRTRILLGHRSDTDDADGTVTEVPTAVPPTEEAIRAALPQFVGTISQLPPAYSALKVAGQRAHELARSGADVKLAARPVNVYRIDLLGYAWPHLDLEIDCGKGTYIRSISRDLGDALGVGGLVQTLRRTRVGPFLAEQGVGLDVTDAPSRLRPMGDAIHGIPRATLSDEQIARIRQGQRVQIAPDVGYTRGPLAVFDSSRELIAIGQTWSEFFIPSTVLPKC